MVEMKCQNTEEEFSEILQLEAFKSFTVDRVYLGIVRVLSEIDGNMGIG